MAIKDTDLLFIFRNRLPDLSTPFDSFLSSLGVFDLGLSGNPIAHPVSIGTARGLGWQIFWIYGDCRDGS